MELMRLMQTEEEEVRQKELNTIAEIVIERITYKLRGLEFTNTSAQKAPQEVAEAELQKFMSGYGG
jgi:HEAT repeat protein